MTDVLRRAVLRPGRDAMVVIQNRTLVGILTATDIARMLELVRLGRKPTRKHTSHPSTNKSHLPDRVTSSC